MTLDSDARAIARAGIRAVDPVRAVRGVLRAAGGGGLKVGGRLLRPKASGRRVLVAIGKAAAAMADAAHAIAGPDLEGLVVTPHGYPAPRSDLRSVFGDHPVPGRGSLRAGTALLSLVRATGPEDAILFLISGGGSAVAEVPAGGLSLSALSRTTDLLLASGAPIGAMNAVRRHLSRIKGGRLAEAGRAGAFATVAISDVVGDRPSDIASGPTVPDPSTYRDALAVLRQYRLGSRLPTAVVAELRAGARGARAETPKPGTGRFRGSAFVLAATNRRALEAAAVEARRRGYRDRVLSSRVTGETRPVAERFARQLLRAGREGGRRPVALLSGGETTVTLGPRPGRGGRNQEFALATAAMLAGRNALVLSIGTDGIDGPTDAAGGWVDGQTAALALRGGWDLSEALHSHAAYPALSALGGLLRTGPTGTNVMDLHVGLARPLRPEAGSLSPGTGGSNRPGAAPSNRRRRS